MQDEPGACEFAQLEEAMPSTPESLPSLSVSWLLFDKTCPGKLTYLCSKFQGEGSEWCKALFIPCRIPKYPKIVRVGIKKADAIGGIRFTRAWIGHHIPGQFCVTRVYVNTYGPQQSFLVISSASQRTPNKLFNAAQGKSKRWTGDILILREDGMKAGSIIDLEPYSPSFIHLLRYMMFCGDWHRKPLPGGGTVPTQSGVLHVIGYWGRGSGVHVS